MTYKDALDALYAALPAFHRIGPAALKPGLGNILTLSERLGNPHKAFKSIHVAGTNGKGSTSHMLASILQEAGYKTGLYTSPHLKDYRERIRVNGQMISEERITRFVDDLPALTQGFEPSFFEVSTALAFKYFAEEQVDIAVVEVGLGGRLDCTNIITPKLSIITNIGMDHVDILGPTLQDIAREKAGIIKPGVPLVVSERQPEIEEIFLEVTEEAKAPIVFASDEWDIRAIDGHVELERMEEGDQLRFRAELGLKGLYQLHNLAGVAEAVYQLNNLGYRIKDKAFLAGLERVAQNTGIWGRWTLLKDHPKVIADTGHNAHGLRYTLEQAAKEAGEGRLTIILGVVGDKDLDSLFPLLPRDATYYFAEPTVFRKLPAQTLAERVRSATGLTGTVIPNVNVALKDALANAAKDDLILITGSNFLVTDLDNL